MPTDEQRENESRWIEVANLAELTGLGGVLEEVSGAVDTVNGVIDNLTAALQVLVEIAEVASEVVSGVQDAQAAAIKGFIKVLETAKDAIIELLDDILKFGPYILPHFYDGFDMDRAIRQAIVARGREGTEFGGVDDEIVRVPNPDNPSDYHYERVRKAGRPKDPDFDQFVKDIIESLDDERDPLRPVFDANDKVSAMLLIAASDDLLTFILGYLLLNFLWGWTGTIGEKVENQQAASTAKLLYQYLQKSVGQADSLGRFDNFDANTREGFVEGLQLLRKFFARGEAGEDLLEPFRDILDFLKKDSGGQSSSDTLGITKVTLSGISKEYTIIDSKTFTFSGSSFKQDPTPILTNQPNSVNFANKVTMKAETTGEGTLYATYDWGEGTTYTENLGSTFKRSTRRKSNTFLVDVPLYPSGQATEDRSYVANESIGDPTTITLAFTNRTGGSATEENETKTFQVSLPKFNQLGNKKRGQTRDGYSQNVRYLVSPANRVTRRKAAEFLGISVDEVEGRFPEAASSGNLDLGKFGPDFKEVDIEVVVNPAVNINKSFSGTLIVNGIEYTSDRKTIGTQTATLLFKDIKLGDDNNQVFFVSNIRQLEFFSSQNPDNDEYRLFSRPHHIQIRALEGQLFPVRITSGTLVNASETAQVNPAAIERYNSILGNDEAIGSNAIQKLSRNARYTLTGTKNNDANLYALVRSEDGSDDKVVLMPNGILFNKEVSRIPTFGNTSSSFSNTIELKIGNNDKKRYVIEVYQTTNKSLFEELKKRLEKGKEGSRIVEDISENFPHQSEKATINVLATNKTATGDPPPPNWISFSMDKFFPLTTPIEQALDGLIKSIKGSIPAGPYDGLLDWIDAMKDRIEGLIDIFETIKNIINAINSLLQIGGTGIWTLAIAGANGNEGFKQRLRKAPVPQELANAKFATGLVFLTPDVAGQPSILTLFDNIPSAGTDNVKVPESGFKASKKIFKDTTEELKNKREEVENLSKAKINDIDTDAITKLSLSARDIDPPNFSKSFETEEK